MTNCFSLSDYIIKTSRRRHFMHIFTELFLKSANGLLKEDGCTCHLTARKLGRQLLRVAFVYLTRKTLLYVGDTKK